MEIIIKLGNNPFLGHLSTPLGNRNFLEPIRLNFLSNKGTDRGFICFGGFLNIDFEGVVGEEEIEILNNLLKFCWVLIKDLNQKLFIILQ